MDNPTYETTGEMLSAEANRILAEYGQMILCGGRADGIPGIQSALDAIFGYRFADFLTALCVILAADKSGDLGAMINRTIPKLLLADVLFARRKQATQTQVPPPHCAPGNSTIN